MKKFLALLLSLSMVLALSACGGTKSDDDNAKGDETKTDAPAETATDFKVGFIMLHDENSTYDLNFINAAKEACEKLGVEYKIITNVPEGQECYDKAAELADDQRGHLNGGGIVALYNAGIDIRHRRLLNCRVNGHQTAAVIGGAGKVEIIFFQNRYLLMIHSIFPQKPDLEPLAGQTVGQRTLRALFVTVVTAQQF